jgi:cellobiose-specific phosphotransferase system component IIC
MLKSKQAIKAIEKTTIFLICLNDNIHIRNYDQVMKNIQNAFEHILPHKSNFEI